MSSAIHKIKEHGLVLKHVNEIRKDAENAFVIHYSCESFYDTVDGKTARVTSIAVRNLANAQTYSFSIHKMAEQTGHPLREIADHYDALEKGMLDEFFSFLKEHPGHCFIHWNMRDINYGFPALEHRYKVLKGVPYQVPDNKKFDLARGLVSIYGRSYVGHGDDGRFLNICRLNKITDRDALTGKGEADAFANHEYIKLHQSTLRKVDMMANVFERVAEGSLKTNAKFHEIYGLNPKDILEFIQGHWAWSLIVMASVVAGLVMAFL